MSHVRILSRAFVVLALVATALALAASPASAQDIRVITFDNAEGTTDTATWQVRVTVVSLGGCTPEQGLGAEGYTSGWLNEGSEGGAALNLAVCAYEISAQARRKTNEVCDAEVGWGTSPTYSDRITSGDRGTETTVSVRHKAGEEGDQATFSCGAAVSVTFEVDPEKVVVSLPAHAEDDLLEERVQRAVEVTDFAVRVRPDRSTRNVRGCNVTLSFTIQGGEDGAVTKDFDGIPTGQRCSFTAFVINDVPPFVVDDGGTPFTTSGSSMTAGSMTVDLASQVKIRPARIAIIQDVVGDASDEGVSYSITRTCAGIHALPPTIVPTGGPGLYRLPGGDWRASLLEGRYTVHSNQAPNFGPGATYHAAARSITSSVIEGCTVSVAIEHVPEDCVVAGGETQTRTWRRSRQFLHFDFEFDISCGGAAAQPSVDDDLPPTPAHIGGAESTSPDVRIVARKLESGKIEFGLQQRRNQDTWTDAVLPRARLFPTTARVGAWLQSTPLVVTVAEGDADLAADIQVRIVARKASNGNVEFALQQRGDDGSWGGRQMLTRRFFPADTAVGRWLRSSVFTINGG